MNQDAWQFQNGKDPSIPVARCNESIELNRQLRELVSHDASPIPRYGGVGSCLALCLEHQSSIAVLVGTGRFASAGALTRPALECLGGAAWFLYCADPARVEDVFEGRKEIPHLDKQARALAKVKYVTTLGLLELMTGNGVVFHQFTHASSFQLRRRYSENSEARTYSKPELDAVLFFADIFVLMTAAVYAATRDDPSLSSFLKSSIDRLMGQMLSGIPGAETWDGWDPLPPTQQPLGRTVSEILAKRA